ncbi:uncharacterized protein LOC141677854 isoform X2 [Apium graveolens]|uniref:uncharacterized protein LOC141677854 isoform X2 n=1 Tax=Apium graveolens TaxID=4045 RepID=UPI003D7B5434
MKIWRPKLRYTFIMEVNSFIRVVSSTTKERAKRATSQKKSTNEGQASAQGEQQPKRKRGRPAKAKNVQVVEPPPKVQPVGVGVYTSARDGNTYFQTVGGSTLKVSSSNPTPVTKAPVRKAPVQGPKPPPPTTPVPSSQTPVPSLKTFNRRSRNMQSSSQP